MLVDFEISEFDRLNVERISRQNDYIFEGVLGGGGHGRVYAVRENREGADGSIPLAMKIHSYKGGVVLHADITHETQIIEALSQYWVSHPNVMPLKEVGIKSDHMYLVMPRAMGGVVNNVIEQTPELLTDEVIATILYQVAEGFEALDAAGIYNHHHMYLNTLLMNPLTADPASVHAVISDFGEVNLGRILDRHAEGRFGPQVGHSHLFLLSHMKDALDSGLFEQPQQPLDQSPAAKHRLSVSMRAFELAASGIKHTTTPAMRKLHFRPNAQEPTPESASVGPAIDTGDPHVFEDLRRLADTIELPEFISPGNLDKTPRALLPRDDSALSSVRVLAKDLLRAAHPNWFNSLWDFQGPGSVRAALYSHEHHGVVEFTLGIADALGVTPVPSPKKPDSEIGSVRETTFIGKDVLERIPSYRQR